MPNKRFHIKLGAASGGVVAGMVALQRESPDVVLETVAGIVGGTLGGMAPDVIEPAVSPRHRAFFHGAVAGTALSTAAFLSWEANCRAQSAHWDSVAALHDPSCQLHADCKRSALAWRLMAALIVGIAVGYASHLVADAQTPLGIPLITR